jgi:hypothetical protein
VDQSVNAIPPFEYVTDVYPVADRGSLTLTYFDDVGETTRKVEVPLQLPSQLLLGNTVVSNVELTRDSATGGLSLVTTSAKGVRTSLAVPAMALPSTVPWSSVVQRYWLAEDSKLQETRRIAEAALALGSAATAASAAAILTQLFPDMLLPGVGVVPPLPSLPDDDPDQQVKVPWAKITGAPCEWSPDIQRVGFFGAFSAWMPGYLYLRQPVYALPEANWNVSELGGNWWCNPQGDYNAARFPMLEPMADRLSCNEIFFRPGAKATNPVTFANTVAFNGAFTRVSGTATFSGPISCNGASVAISSANVSISGANVTLQSTGLNPIRVLSDLSLVPTLPNTCPLLFSGNVPALSMWRNDIPVANANVANGWLSNTDWRAFNAKQVALVTDANSRITVSNTGLITANTWQADWNHGLPTEPSFILNKPGLANATSNGLMDSRYAAWVEPMVSNVYCANKRLGIRTSDPRKLLHVAGQFGGDVYATNEAIGLTSRFLGLYSGHDINATYMESVPSVMWTEGQPLRFGTTPDLTSTTVTDVMRLTANGANLFGGELKT